MLQTPNSHISLLEALRDPSVRAGIYLWLMIGGLGVLLVNALGV